MENNAENLIIKNAMVCTMNGEMSILKNSSILLEGGTIRKIGTFDELTSILAGKHFGVVDAEGKLAMPGMICAHTHFYGAFARGMALPGRPPSNFGEILEGLWWKLDKALGEEDVYYSALMLMADAIRHGTTTMMDHHASPNFISGSLDVIEKAAERMGVRSCLCYEVTDRNGPDQAREGIEENVRFLKKVRSGRTGLTRGSFGLHASMSVSEETLMDCVEEARRLDSGFHVHVAEGRCDVRDSKKKYNRSIVSRFHESGILGPDTIAVHCVHVDEGDMALLNGTLTNVVHNPQSNMNNAVGVAPVGDMRELGINVGIGTDGFSHDMFREMKFVYVLHKLHGMDPRLMGGDAVLSMQTHANSRIVSRFWKQPLGVIEEGAVADIILVDYHPPTPMDSENLPWHIEFGLDSTGVTHTFVDGKMLMENGHILGWDPVENAEKARYLAKKVWERL